MPQHSQHPAITAAQLSPDSRLPTLYLLNGTAFLRRCRWTNAYPTFPTDSLRELLIHLLQAHPSPQLLVLWDPRDDQGMVPTETTPGLEAQRSIQAWVHTMGLPQYDHATLTAEVMQSSIMDDCKHRNMPVCIVTNDPQDKQYLSNTVHLIDPRPPHRITTRADLATKGITPEQIPDFLALVGHRFQHIPGIPAIGPHAAAQLLSTYKTLDELLQHLQTLHPVWIRTHLQTHAEILTTWLKRLQRPSPVPLPDEFAISSTVIHDPNTLLTHLRRDKAPQSTGGSLTQRHQQARDLLPAVTTWLTRLDPAEPVGVAYRLGHPIHGIARSLESLSLSTPKGHSLNLPFNSLTNPSDILRTIQPFLTADTPPKVTHQLKPLWHALTQVGVPPAGTWHDTELIAYLLTPTHRQYSIETIATGLHLQTPNPNGDLSQTATLLANCLHPLLDRLGRHNLLTLYLDLERPLIKILATMEARGLSIDVQALQALDDKIGEELHALRRELNTLAGEPVPLEFPQELSRILFEKLKLPYGRKTQHGYSTDEETLQQLTALHPLPKKLLLARHLTKLKTTHTEGLRRAYNPQTQRLHTTLNQTTTATGRLSSSDPNLMNIPVRHVYGRRLRHCFIALPEHTLISADYEQIEPRILAHLSQDARLLDIFASKQDLHTLTAMDLFRCSAKTVTPTLRRAAKEVLFGILYGITPRGLADALACDPIQAEQYMTRFFEQYQGVNRYIEETVAIAQRTGVVRTILGRLRPVPELLSPNPAEHALGRRIAINTPIQGSAADLVKTAMLLLDDQLQASCSEAAILLQVHDELLIECPQTLTHTTTELTQATLEDAGAHLGLSVQVPVHLGHGPTWAQAHPS